MHKKKSGMVEPLERGFGGGNGQTKEIGGTNSGKGKVKANETVNWGLRGGLHR